jgi:hypothetical protein
MNKVVARFADGYITKGLTPDFLPGKDVFHVRVDNTPAGEKPVEICTKDLKALFFVKNFAGDPQHVNRNEFDPEHPWIGHRIKVVFNDGEVLVGTTTGYKLGPQGFFVKPADTYSNNERCYVVVASTKEISFL